MVASKALERAIGLASIVILARILTPQDFGLIAMVMAFVAVVELLQSFGFDVALIQARSSSKEDFDSAWALNVVLGAGCAVLIASLAPMAATFYREPRLVSLAYCLAFGTLIFGFENIGPVAFRRELQFNKEFHFVLIKKLGGAIVTISLALILRTFWALVVGMIFSRVLGVAVSYWIHPYRPHFRFRRAGSLLRFSKWLFLNNLVGVARYKIGDVIVGRAFGASILGVFNISMEIASLPTTELSAPINRAVFPGYSRWAQSEHGLRDGFLKTIAAIFLVTAPAAVGIGLVAEPLVMVILGEQWHAAAALITVLAYFGLTQALQSNFGYVFIANGNPGYVTIYATVMLACEGLFASVGAVNFGVRGAAWGLLAGGLLPMPFIVLVMSRMLKVSAFDWLLVTWRPALATLLMIGVVHLWIDFTANIVSSPSYAFVLTSSIGIGAVVYSLCTYAAWRSIGRPEGPEFAVITTIAAFGKRIREQRWPR